MTLPDAQTIQHLRRAGRIAHECINKGAKQIKPGASMVEVLDSIEANIQQAGAHIAFPAQISLNNIAAHFCPTDDEDVIFADGDIAKLDIGVHIDGFVADTALTVDLGDHQALCQASKQALDQALTLIKPGITLGEIGRTIQSTIESNGFRPIRNLSGHGLGQYEIHTSPSIPNIDNNSHQELTLGMTVAIEPFASTGAGEIFESSNPTIFSLVNTKPTRSMITREVLKTIHSYNNLPFTTRWLSRIHGIGKTRFALRELQQIGSVIPHPPLPDKAGGLVSQHEHSVLVLDKPLIYTKDLD